MKHSIIILILQLIMLLIVDNFADGTLSVKTSPDKIEVWLDDHFIGHSPVVFNHLRSGVYSLKLLSPTIHSSYIEQILINDNDTTFIEKIVQSNYGSITVITEPPNASVFISSELGKTPLQNEFIVPGKYMIEISPSNQRFKPLVQEILITQGKATSITHSLEKQIKFDKKAKLRLVLGAGSVAGFVFAIIENGKYKKYEEKGLYNYNINTEIQKKLNNSNLLRIFGLVGGLLCISSLEIVSFIEN